MRLLITTWIALAFAVPVFGQVNLVVNSFNADTIGLPKGTPVSIVPSNGGYQRASSASVSNAAFGMLFQDGPIGFQSQVQISGELDLTDWTGITGSSSLQANSYYFISATPGKLSLASSGISQVVGVALSTTRFLVNPIYLNTNISTVAGSFLWVTNPPDGTITNINTNGVKIIGPLIITAGSNSSGATFGLGVTPWTTNNPKQFSKFISADGQAFSQWLETGLQVDGSLDQTLTEGWNITFNGEPVDTNHASLQMFYESHELDAVSNSLETINYVARHPLFGFRLLGQYGFYDKVGQPLFGQVTTTFAGNNINYSLSSDYGNVLMSLGMTTNNCEMVFPKTARIGFHGGTGGDLIDVYDSGLNYRSLFNWDAVNKRTFWGVNGDLTCVIGGLLRFNNNSDIGTSDSIWAPNSGYFTGGLVIGAPAGSASPGVVQATNQVYISGTTNFIKFGTTNTAPVSTAAPTAWVSVQINGSGIAYRVPLYQ